MIPGAEIRVRLDDRLGVAAVTYILFGVKLGPALALSVVLVFAIWIGWRWLCSNIPQSPEQFALIRTPPPNLPPNGKREIGRRGHAAGSCGRASRHGHARNAPNMS
jgi:hypothetical protein